MRLFKDLAPRVFTNLPLLAEGKHGGNRSGKDEPANRFCCRSSYLRHNGVPSSSRILVGLIFLSKHNGGVTR